MPLAINGLTPPKTGRVTVRLINVSLRQVLRRLLLAMPVVSLEGSRAARVSPRSTSHCAGGSSIRRPSGRTFCAHDFPATRPSSGAAVTSAIARYRSPPIYQWHPSRAGDRRGRLTASATHHRSRKGLPGSALTLSNRKARVYDVLTHRSPMSRHITESGRRDSNPRPSPWQGELGHCLYLHLCNLMQHNRQLQLTATNRE